MYYVRHEPYIQYYLPFSCFQHTLFEPPSLTSLPWAPTCCFRSSCCSSILKSLRCFLQGSIIKGKTSVFLPLENVKALWKCHLLQCGIMTGDKIPTQSINLKRGGRQIYCWDRFKSLIFSATVGTLKALQRARWLYQQIECPRWEHMEGQPTPLNCQ